MKLGEIETRLVKLEKVVSQLKSQASKSSGKRNRWWVTDAGRFADDPVFDEIVELGREYRKSLGPKRRKGQRADS